MLKGIRKKIIHKRIIHRKEKRESQEDAGEGGDKSNFTMVSGQTLEEITELTEETLLKPIMTFDDCPAYEVQNLLLKKLRLCQLCFDFDDEDSQALRDAKRSQLMQLCDYVGTAKGVYNDTVLNEIVELVSVNAFRPLPPKISTGMPDADDEMDFYDPAWEHLQFIYELLLRFVVSNDVDVLVLQNYFDKRFVKRLLLNFDSEDRREKDYLKTITHRLYARLVGLRVEIRSLMREFFLEFINNPQPVYFRGIPELLEIMGTIISGFVLPLKDEHVDFLTKVLIPLHKSKYYGNYFRQVLYCEVQYLNKKRELAEDVIKGLLKYWPVSNTIKEMQFVGELEDLLELAFPESFAKIMVPLFETLARSITKPHFQVQERILFLWHNEFIVGNIANHVEVILPIMFPVLHASAQAHWNSSVHHLALNILKIFNEMDADVVKKVTEEFNARQAPEAAKQVERQRRWTDVNRRASDASAAPMKSTG